MIKNPEYYKEDCDSVEYEMLNGRTIFIKIEDVLKSYGYSAEMFATKTGTRRFPDAIATADDLGITLNQYAIKLGVEKEIKHIEKAEKAYRVRKDVRRDVK